MERALREYVKMLRCLPTSTLVIWLLPYGSFKVPWQKGLVDGTVQMMRRLQAEGAFQSSVVLDTYNLSTASHHPPSWDGNHYASPFQTVVWSVESGARFGPT